MGCHLTHLEKELIDAEPLHRDGEPLSLCWPCANEICRGSRDAMGRRSHQCLGFGAVSCLTGRPTSALPACAWLLCGRDRNWLLEIGTYKRMKQPCGSTQIV